MSASTVMRIDVRSTEIEARTLQARQKAQGFAVTLESAQVAAWNWAPDGPVPDTIAGRPGDSREGQVWVVISRAA